MHILAVNVFKPVDRYRWWGQDAKNNNFHISQAPSLLICFVESKSRGCLHYPKGNKLGLDFCSSLMKPFSRNRVPENLVTPLCRVMYVLRTVLHFALTTALGNLSGESYFIVLFILTSTKCKSKNHGEESISVKHLRKRKKKCKEVQQLHTKNGNIWQKHLKRKKKT